MLRRAAELDGEGGVPVVAGGLDPRVVEAAAVEAGFSRQSVRRALDEVLHPDLHPPDLYAGARLPSRELVVERVAPVSSEEAEARVGRFLRRQRFAQTRVFADGSRWEPRRGAVTALLRGLDLGGRFRLKEVRSVTVTVSELAPPGGDEGGDDEGRPAERPQVLLRLTLDLAGVRSVHAAWLAGGGVIGGAAVAGTAAAVGFDPVVLLTLPVAGLTTVGGHLVGRRQVRAEVERIHTAVAGLLDQIEHGARADTSRGRRPRGASR